jgi:hypothetical protein
LRSGEKADKLMSSDLRVDTKFKNIYGTVNEQIYLHSTAKRKKGKILH